MPLDSANDIPQQAFQHWWQRQGDWVEPPNARRGGESGVQRLLDHSGVLYAKRQIGHIYRSLLHPGGRPTVLRERNALQALDALGVSVPHLVYCGVEHDPQQGWRGLLVTEALQASRISNAGMSRVDASSAVRRRMPGYYRKSAQPWRVCTGRAGSMAVCMPSTSSSS